MRRGSPLRVEVAVVGAGPAGATAALNLAPVRDVVVLDARETAAARIGEALVPAARRLLADMGLLDAFLGEGHGIWHANRATWGSAVPFETDFLRDPDGPGWHLDRARFDAWLRSVAVARGALLVAPAKIKAIEPEAAGWCVHAETQRGPIEIRADLLIDAAGRSSPVARRLGAKRRVADRLSCGWVHGRADGSAHGAGLTYVEAEEGGWWYSAPIPGRTRVLAFFTDADLPQARAAADVAALVARARRVPGLSALVEGCGFRPTSAHGYLPAHGSCLEPCAGKAWLAVGDAAVSVDPLSSQGLLNALFTGLAAAEAADRHLRGADDALLGYMAAIGGVARAYRRQLAAAYLGEARWPDAPFWKWRQHRSGLPLDISGDIRRSQVKVAQGPFGPDVR